MKNTSRWKINPKILIIIAIAAIVVAAVFLSTQTRGEDSLSEAVEGGELTLTSVGRNYESLTQFVQNDEEQTRQLLEAARATLENARAKFGSARRTSDEYVLGMLDNYESVVQASDVMALGVDNLLLVSKNLTDAIDFHRQKEFEKASAQAAYCLTVLEPLLSDFETSNTALSDINVVYIPSGQRDRLTLRISQYGNEAAVYNQYVLLLRSILEGEDYLKLNAQLEDLMRQLQSAIANNDDQAAQDDLRQQISNILQQLRDPSYQNAADTASQLNPNSFSGAASDAAQELRNKLRDLEGIDAFENYLQSLEKYLEATRHFEQGETAEAEQDINEGLSILQGQATDQELEGLYAGLRQAFNTLELRIKGQPPQG
jgi:hypothetical protein